MNKVILMGRLTADPEFRQTQSGISYTRFTVAVNRRFKNHKGEYEADFINCQAWRQTAEFVCKYFTKGQMIALDGTLRTGSYTDKNHQDVTHYTTDVMVENVEFCGSKSDNSQAHTSNNAYTAPTTPAPPTQYNNPTPTANTAYSAPQTPQSGQGDFIEILSDGDVPF